jgi:hypothetical protein
VNKILHVIYNFTDSNYMNEKQRQKNEREYEQWIETEEGGRIYLF